MGAARGCNQCKGEVVSEGCSQWEPALSVADGLLEPLDCQKSMFRVNPSCGYAHAPVAGGGGLSDTQLYPLPRLCVVTAGLSVCGVPIAHHLMHYKKGAKVLIIRAILTKNMYC